jgi:hypothetical protein
MYSPKKVLPSPEAMAAARLLPLNSTAKTLDVSGRIGSAALASQDFTGSAGLATALTMATARTRQIRFMNFGLD